MNTAATASGAPLRFAPHLGYRPPFEPLFKALVGSDDPLEHIAFAADQGFAGIFDAGTRRRSVEEQARIGEALARRGLAAGCVLYTRFENLRQPAWGHSSAEARAWIRGEIEQAIAAAGRIGSRQIAIVAAADPALPLAPQREAMAVHLRMAADLAGQHGMTLAVEALDAARVPGMLLHHLADAIDVLRAARHPGARLIFDTAHVQAMDGAVLEQLRGAWDWIEVIQLAGHPGRLEPRGSSFDFGALMSELRSRRWGGLLELEHGWNEPGVEAERQWLQELQAMRHSG